MSDTDANTRHWIGLDIGGANLKISVPGQQAREVVFPLWREAAKLEPALSAALAGIDGEYRLAVTMTGELADGFETKTAGVIFIADAVMQVVSKSAALREAVFYQTDGHWCSAEHAKREPLSVAAANWHALARYSSRFLKSETGFVIDIGSTTTDIIPVLAGRPINENQTDFDRLQRLQLVYTGVSRSNVAGLIDAVQYNEHNMGVANEFFATIRDAFLWERRVPEQHKSLDTADGRPATRACAGQRLARLFCSDLDEIGGAAVDVIARAAIDAVEQRLGHAILRVVNDNPEVPLRFLLSGQGAWLIDSLLLNLFPQTSTDVVRLADQIGQAAARAAAAHALLVLATDDDNRIRST